MIKEHNMLKGAGYVFLRKLDNVKVYVFKGMESYIIIEKDIIVTANRLFRFDTDYIYVGKIKSVLDIIVKVEGEL